MMSNFTSELDAKFPTECDSECSAAGTASLRLSVAESRRGVPLALALPVADWIFKLLLVLVVV